MISPPGDIPRQLLDCSARFFPPAVEGGGRRAGSGRPRRTVTTRAPFGDGTLRSTGSAHGREEGRLGTPGRLPDARRYTSSEHRGVRGRGRRRPAVAAGLRRPAPPRGPPAGPRGTGADAATHGPGPRGVPAPGRRRPRPALERPRPLLRRRGRGHAPHPR